MRARARAGGRTTPRTARRSAALLADKPLMQNVLADLARRVRGGDRARRCGWPHARRRRTSAALPPARACRWRSSGSASAPRRGRRGAGVPRRQRLRRGVRAAAALPRGAAELDLGGLGQRQRARRAAGAGPRAGRARGVLRRGRRWPRGADPRLDAAVDRLRARRWPTAGTRRRPAGWSSRWRWCCRASLLVRHAPARSPTPSAPPGSAGDGSRGVGARARAPCPPGWTPPRSSSGPRPAAGHRLDPASVPDGGMPEGNLFETRDTLFIMTTAGAPLVARLHVDFGHVSSAVCMRG